MKWFNRDAERKRFYLLPGMGGRALRRKQKMMLQWAIAVGLIVSVIVCAIIYWAYNHPF